MLELYEVTSGRRWTDQQGWLDGRAPVWHGVTVEPASRAVDGTINGQGHVRAIHLYHNDLQGFLPSSLSSLTRLRDLELGSNDLRGVLPASLGALSDLETLDLTGNRLSGAIPDSFGSLGRLATLELTGNQLTGSIPAGLGKIPLLTTLGLSYNYFDLAPDSAFLQSVAAVAGISRLRVSYLPQNTMVPTRNIVLGGTLAFGEVGVGATQSSILSIKNTGNSPLRVTGLACPEGFKASFQGIIASGAARDVPVAFNPARTGVFRGELTVDGNATGGLAAIAVSGSGATPTRIIETSGSLAFGAVGMGTSSSATLTLKNTGNAPLQVDEITGPAGYQCSFSGVIPAKEERDATVIFTPAVTQSYPGRLTIHGEHTGGSDSVPVSGRGAVATREIELLGNMEFDPIEAGSSSRSDLTIHNVGNAPLTITGISYPAGFNDGGYHGTIPANGYQDVPVTFRPTAGQTYSGDLAVHGDQTSGTGTMAIAGSGVLTMLPFFAGQAALTRGVYYLAFPNGNYFGYYSYLADRSYLYHFDLGYEKIFDAADGQAGLYLFDFASGHFFYSSPTFPFPYLYDFTLQAVLYYYADPAHPGHYNTGGVRFFHNFATGQIITQ